MDAAILTIYTITAISMVFSAFFSGMEIAFISSNRVRTRIDLGKDGMISRIIRVFYTHKDMFITTMLVGNNVMLVIYGMGMAQLLDPSLQHFLGGNEALVLIAQTLISTGIILVTGEFFPKTIFRINPNNSLRRFSLPLLLSYLVLYPVSWFAAKLSQGLMKLFRIKVDPQRFGAITMGELDAYLQENIDTQEDEHKEVETEVKIFQNALDFSATHLRDCMIPRNEIVAVDIDAIGREELSRLFTQSGFSKIIVYRDDIDNVLGSIHVSELFDPAVDWKTRIKTVLYAPETKLANKMMQMMLKGKRSMAIVVDEFGGTAGLVTLEDIVEEIFGDIEDEHDRKSLIDRSPSEGVYEFSGRLEIEGINEKYHLDIEESDDYQTIAGYLLFNLEAIPHQGETFKIGDLTFTILKKTAAKIELIRVERVSQQERSKD